MYNCDSNLYFYEDDLCQNNIDDIDESDVDYEDLYFGKSSDDESFDEKSDRVMSVGNRRKYRRVENKICSYVGCHKNAYYREENSLEFFCREHKSENMYNPRRKYCKEPGCHKPAFYANDGGEKKFCRIHKLAGMINVCTRKCSVIGCNTYPSYNFEGQKGCGDRCKTHILDGMVDVRNPKCKFLGCTKFARFHKKTKCYTHKNL